MKTAVYFGGKQAGCAGLLTIIACGYNIKGVVSYDIMMGNLAEALNFPVYETMKHPDVALLMSDCDLMASVHCREIITKDLLDLPRLGCINAHPCLFKYKGATPIQRLLESNDTLASVGVHYMTEKIDEGEVLSEIFVDVSGCNSVEEVYNALYPYYSLSLIQAIKIIEDRG